MGGDIKLLLLERTAFFLSSPELLSSCLTTLNAHDNSTTTTTKMNRRTFEGSMEWEYQNQGPVDISSPFAQISQKSQMCKLAVVFLQNNASKLYYNC